MTEIEVLLAQSIPTLDFFGLEDEDPKTQEGEDALKYIKEKNCMFVAPEIEMIHISPVYEFKFPEGNKIKCISLPKPIPLALKSNPDLNTNQQIDLLNEVTGVLAYVMGIDYAFVRNRKVFYDSASKEIIKTIWDNRFREREDPLKPRRLIKNTSINN